MSNDKPAAASRGLKIHFRWIDVLVLLATIALSLVASWPLPTHLATHIPGRQADARVFQWNNWWIKRALLNGQNPLYTDRFYYPTGASLAGHNLNWVSSLLSVPLDGLFGPTVTYNLLFLLTIWGSGYAMYLLVRYLTQRRDAAFVAGLVFAFFPYHLSGNWDGQMNLANTQWLPLVAWFLLRTVDHKRLRDALLCGLCVALSGLDCWFFLPFLGLWGLVWLAYSLIWERRKWSRRLVWLLVGAALISGLLIAPAIWSLLAESGRETVGEAVDYFAEHKASDLWAFFVPSSDHPLLADLAAPAYDRFAHWRPAFMGYTVLALALYATLRAVGLCHCDPLFPSGERSDKTIPTYARQRSLCRPAPRIAMTNPQALLWAASGALFAWLALGTTLRFGGMEHSGVPMLLSGLIRISPAFKLIRQPSRFNVMAGQSLAVLVGLACADLFSRLSRARLRSGLAILLSALILFEYLAWPCPLLPAHVSPWYETLAQEQEDFALVELPLGLLTSGHALYGQTVHGKRLVNGYVARASSDVNPFVLSNPLLKALYLRIEPDPNLHDLPAALGTLAANDVRLIVIHKTPLPPLPAVEVDVLEAWYRTLAGLGLEPIYEDEELVVYPTGAGLDQTGWPVARLGNDLELASLAAQRLAHNGRHLLQIDLVWRATHDLDQDLDLGLSLRGPLGLVGARSAHPEPRSAPPEPQRISPHYPTSLWRQGVVVAESYALPLTPSLAGGPFTLVLDVPGAGRAEVPIEVSRQARPLAAGLDARDLADVTFGEQMWLLGSDWRVTGEQTALDLCWQALDVMGTNYKVFVHLLDAQSQIVAQVDTMPRGWSYPTTLWSRQEIFCDRILLDTRDLAPGEYRAALGVYRPETGRLPAIDGQGRRIADDRAILDVPLVVPYVRP